MANKCPESIEELENLERLIPMCKKELYVQAKAKIESGAACSIREASRQLGEETGKKPESIRRSIKREQSKQGGTLSHLAETNKYTPKSINKEIVRMAKEITQEERAINQQKRINKRIERDNQFKEKPLPDRKYGILYADPPWRYEHSVSKSRDIENQYPTMTLDEIKAVDINKIADTDCVLFMWVTSPKLSEAVEVLMAWEFTYKTCAVWIKDKIGMGYYFRQQHELLFVATKGKPVLPTPTDRVSSVFSFPRTTHSTKPPELYNIIDNMYPDMTKLELFSRGNDRENWEVWGFEAK